MGKAPPPPDIDIAALLESVHGRSDESRREEQVDQALKAIETTHRKASMAVRNFEHHGRLEAEQSVLAALGALADDADAPAPGHHGAQVTQRPDPEATQVTAPPRDATPLAHAGAGADGAAPACGERRAPAMPSAAPPHRPKTPAILSDEPTAPGAGPISEAAANETTVPPPSKVSSTEVTRTFAIDAQPSGVTRADATAAAPPDNAKLRPSSVYSGRGADMANKEPTQTKLIRRPKR